MTRVEHSINIAGVAVITLVFFDLIPWWIGLAIGISVIMYDCVLMFRSLAQVREEEEREHRDLRD